MVPQYTGLPGWVVLGHDMDGIPKAIWTDGKAEEHLPIVMDERLCFDTVLRCVRLSPKQIVAYDVWTVNGECVHGSHVWTHGRKQACGCGTVSSTRTDTHACTLTHSGTRARVQACR